MQPTTDLTARYLTDPRRWDIVARTLDTPAIIRRCDGRIRKPNRAQRWLDEVASYHASRAAALTAAGQHSAADRAMRIVRDAQRCATRIHQGCRNCNGVAA